MQKTSYMSAEERIAMLSSTFSVREAAKQFNMTPEATQVLLHRWRKRDLIEAVGLRAGIWVNRMKADSPERVLKARAEGMLKVYPSAKVAGATALIDTGLVKAPAPPLIGGIDTIPDTESADVLRMLPKITRPEIAVIKRGGGQAGEGPHLVHFDRIPATMRWFKDQETIAHDLAGGFSASRYLPGVDCLNGYGVLADMIRSGSKEWQQYPWDQEQFDPEKLEAAGRVLGLDEGVAEQVSAQILRPDNNMKDTSVSMSA